MIKKYLIIIVILFLPVQANSETINYKNTMNQAINNSFDLKMSAMDIEISNAQLKEARSEWYPILSLQFTTEHNQDLASGGGSYAYAGNNVITPYNMYRNMLYTTLQYNLFDFGVTGKKVKIAKQELAQKKIVYDIQLKDLKLKVLDLYTKALQYNNEISVKSEILAIYEDIFKNKEKLFKAGTSDKITIMDEAVKIAHAQNDIANSRLEFKKVLQDLSSYTQQKYEYDSIFVMNIYEDTDNKDIINVSYTNIIQTGVEKNEFDLFFDAYSSLESEYYNLEINKKEAELSILKRQLLPAFRLYTGYSLYGQDPGRYYNSVQDIGQRSFIVGISSTYTFFDGFRNRANREKTSLEIQKLQLEKSKKLYELQKEYEKTFNTYETYIAELSIKNKLLNNVREKAEAFDRMNKNGLSGKNELLSAKADLLIQEFELEKNIADINSKIEGMKIMAGQDL